MGDPMTYIPQTSAILEVDWVTLKSLLVKKEILLQYVETPGNYELYTTDSMVWHTSILKGTSEASDFETNFKSQANARGNLSVVLVDIEGRPAIGVFGIVPPQAGTLVASIDQVGNLRPFITSSTGSCLVTDCGLEPAVLSIGGSSPSTPSTVALTAASGLANWRDFAVEATLAGTNGTTPTGGTLQVFVQCSCDGTNFTDWVSFPSVASGRAAVSYRYSAALSGMISVVGQGLSPALVANTSSNGHPGGWVRVVMIAGTGTNHAVQQVINLLGIRPVT